MINLKVMLLLLTLNIILFSCNDNRNAREIAAQIGDSVITINSLDNLVKQEIYDEKNRIYFIRKFTLRTAIDNAILKKESLKINISIDSLLKRGELKFSKILSFNEFIIQMNIGEKIPNVEREYSLIDRKSKKGQAILKKKYKEKLLALFLDSIKQEYNINILLSPPKKPMVKLENLSGIIYKGNLESRVKLIEISDFECKRCKDNQKLMNYIYKKYNKQICFGYVNYSSYVSLSSLSSMAANSQGYFWQMHDSIFNSSNLLNKNEILSIAKSIGMDMEKFICDLNSELLVDELERNFVLLQSEGIDATPTIIINDKLIFNSSSKEEIERVIDKELFLQNN